MTITVNKWPGFMPGSNKEAKNVKIIITSGTMIDGKKYKSGKRPVEVDEATGRFLVNIGKAVLPGATKKNIENREKDLDVRTR